MWTGKEFGFPSSRHLADRDGTDPIVSFELFRVGNHYGSFSHRDRSADPARTLNDPGIEENPMSIINIAGGALLLTLGRKVFWLFVAGVGFYADLELATRYLNVKPEWLALLIAVGIGVLGALLAIFFQKLVIGVAGFLAGAFITSRLTAQLGNQVKGWEWLIILIGGIIGIILIYAIFEWALIILSSLAGVILIVQGLKLAALVGILVGVILFVIGLVLQIGLNRRKTTRNRAVSS
jgi:hypothetical protein